MNKKDSFVFYGTFLDTIEKLEAAGDQELAYKVARAIIDVGIYGEYTGGDPLVESFLPTMQLNIENAAKRYEAASNGGKKGGPKKKVDDALIIELKLQGLKNAEVAERANCSVRTVSRVWNEYQASLDTTNKKVMSTQDKTEGKVMSTLDKTGHNQDITNTQVMSTLDIT